MDKALVNFPDWLQLPLAGWVDVAAEWMTKSGAAFFDIIGQVILLILGRLDRFLLWLPWPIVVVAVGLLAWRVAGWRIALLCVFSLVLTGTFGMWDPAMSTLALIGTAVIISVAIGIPLGIFAGKSNTFEALIRPVLDGMQTMPSFVYLIPALLFFGLGKVPAIIATVIYAVPPAIRLTCLGLRQVPVETVEAARAFGSTPFQLLTKVQLPLALPSIMAGINQTTMMALAMAVIASLVGAGGLGLEVLKAIQRIQVGRGVAAGLSIVILAIIIDRITQAFAKSRREALE
jgi:glycine betaine/proline transport system permease protein